MSTRKLILTALVCGLAIMIAGGAKLFQVATDDARVEVLALGTKATLGDMTAWVVDIEQGDVHTDVTVGMAGVEGADGQEGWRLLADGKIVTPSPDSSVGGCVVKRLGATSCIIRFPASTGSVTVAYVRAGKQSQWAR